MCSGTLYPISVLLKSEVLKSEELYAHARQREAENKDILLEHQEEKTMVICPVISDKSEMTGFSWEIL